MSTTNDIRNTLYCGDNLDVLRRHIADESVDLIYLDPPFNSNADYNVLFAEHDQTKAARFAEQISFTRVPRTLPPPPVWPARHLLFPFSMTLAPICCTVASTVRVSGVYYE